MQTLSREDLSKRLRERGFRVTSQRLDVYEALATSAEHMTPDRVLEAVRPRHPSISVNTVYEVLEALSEIGAIQRADIAAGPRRYDANIEPHHHLVCTRCGRQQDIDCAMADAPCLQSPAVDGFQVERAQVTFFGICPTCASGAVR